MDTGKGYFERFDSMEDLLKAQRVGELKAFGRGARVAAGRAAG